MAVRAGFGASDRRGRAPGGWAEGVAGRYRLAVPDDEQLHGMTPNDRDDETGGRLDTVAAGGRRGPDQAELSDDEVVDELPEELQPALVTGDYIFPNTSRRRIPAVLYALFAAGCVAVFLTAGDSPAVNGGWLGAAVLLGGFAVYSWLAGANLDVDERDALVAATKDVGFAVGHASAQLGWRGLLCRPTWRVLLYSAEDPPLQRGLIFVDGLDGRVLERIVEDNPEDWTELLAKKG